MRTTVSADDSALSQSKRWKHEQTHCKHSRKRRTQSLKSITEKKTKQTTSSARGRNDFKEIGLCGCEPNEFSYGYIVQELCRKGWVGKSMDCFKEMRAKGLVPTATVYMAVVCGLALERRLDEGIEVVSDMLRNGMAPDLLTYRTALEEMCREGRADAAFELLEELGRTKGAMDRRTDSDLLEGLHWLCQPRE